MEWFSWLATLLPPPRRTTGDIAVFGGLKNLEKVDVANCWQLTGAILKARAHDARQIMLAMIGVI